MRRLIPPVFLAALSVANPAAARDADTVLRGSLLDAAVEFREEQRGDDPKPIVSRPTSPATTNPTRPERQTRADQSPSAAAEEADSDDDDDDDEKDKDGKDDGVETSFDVALRGGYDTNYDEFKGGKGSSFVEVSTSGSVTREIGDTTVMAQADASFLRLAQLDYAEKPDAATEIALRHKLTDQVALTAAFGTGIDASDDPITLSNAVSVGVESARPGALFSLRASYDNEIAVAERFDDDGGLGVFDFQRPALEGVVMLRPDAKISPYAAAGLSRITFFEKLPSNVEDDDGGVTPSPDRDAVQTTAALGLRTSLSDKLVVKVAGRVTVRDYDQTGLKSRVAFSPDIEATWTLTDDVTVEASYQRTLVESDEFGSLAQDVNAVSFSIDYAPDKGFGVSFTGEYEQTKELGIDMTTDDISLELVTKYRFANKTFLELGLLQSWSVDRDSSEDSSRTRISLGGGYSF